MKNFFKNIITLISAIIVFFLSITWFVYDIGFEPLIGIITSLTTIILSLFFRNKKDNNDSEKSIISKNINTGTINIKEGNVRIGDNQDFDISIDNSKNTAINMEGNISVADTYNQINNIFQKISQGVDDSLDLHIPESFFKTLPSIKYKVLKKAQPLWDSGITANMVKGNNILIEQLLQIYLDLVEMIEKENLIKGVPVRDYYKNKVLIYTNYVYDALSEDGGRMQIIIAGGKISNIIDDCIVNVVKKCTSDKYFSEWLDSWNNYEEELY